MGEGPARRAIGRPRSIDRAKIVAAAHEIGIERLTMRAVASQLGVTTQALYNHIGGRRELLALLANDHGDMYAFDPDESSDWRTWLTDFARSLRQHLLQRPGTASAAATRGPTSLASIRFADRTATKMAAAGFEPAEALLGYRALTELVVGLVQRQESGADDPDRDHAQRALFYEALTDSEPDSLPNLAFIAASWSRRDPEELFEYSVACLLAGLDVRRGWLAGRGAQRPLDRPSSAAGG